MNKALPAILLSFFLMLPVYAEGPMLTAEVESPKKTFAQAHPKAYKAIRKVRFVCILVKPIVETAGAVAQIVLPFVL